MADQETAAVREVFTAKRNLMVKRLTDMGIRLAAEPTSTFYAWGSPADLSFGPHMDNMIRIGKTKKGRKLLNQFKAVAG